MLKHWCLGLPKQLCLMVRKWGEGKGGCSRRALVAWSCSWCCMLLGTAAGTVLKANARSALEAPCKTAAIRIAVR